ncbi:MAG: SGNH/GDSL hydrolase family protein [Lentisphaerota bacterium]
MNIFSKLICLASPLPLMLLLLGCEGREGDGSPSPSPSPSTNSNPAVTNKPYVHVALGDGITTGIGLPAGETPWPDRLKALLNQRVVNEAKAHAKVNYCVNRTDWAIEEYRPGHLLVLAGSNDVGLEEASDYIVGQLLLIVQKAKASGVIPVIATLPPIYGRDADMLNRLGRVNDKIRIMAQGEGVPLADVAAEFGDNRSLILDDGLHPTAEGQQIIAMTFFEAL